MIIAAKFLKSGTLLEHCPDPDRAEFAFIGRSNVGKSTLINVLCRRRALAKTSPKPGKTRVMNFFEVEEKEDKVFSRFYLVDLPGYGYAKVSREQRYGFEDMIVEYLTQRPNLEHVFVLLDSSISPQEIDLEFVEWISKQEIPYVLIFTKTDKTTQKKTHQHIKSFLRALEQRRIVIPGYLAVNSLRPGGAGELEKLIKKLL